MKEVKHIDRDTSWLASYEKSDQTKALIQCQQDKIRQLKNLIKSIECEVELAEDNEYSPEQVLASIQSMVTQTPEEVSATVGYFTWKG